MPNAVTASTANAAGRSAMTASVLVPIEPVAPRMVTRAGPLDRLRSKALCGRIGRVHHRSSPPARVVGAAMRPADQRGERAGEDEPIDPIHQAAMAGQDGARILGAEAPLDRRIRRGRRPDRQPRGRATTATSEPASSATPPARATTSPATSAATTPPMAPAQVFFGETAGQSFGPPIEPPGEEGAGVGRPDDGKDEERSRSTRSRATAAARAG